MTAPPLWPHQRLAVEYLTARRRAALFVPMGGGKTRAVLEALTPERLPALVVAPAAVARGVWPSEARRWRPDLTVHDATGGPGAREASLQAARRSGGVAVVTRDSIPAPPGRDGGGPDLDADGVWATLVLDELSSFRSVSARRTRAAARLSQVVPAVWGLTGTPQPGSLGDLYSQVRLLDHGKRLGRTQQQFRDRWMSAGARLPSGVVTGWSPRPGAAEEVYDLISDLCLTIRPGGGTSSGSVAPPEVCDVPVTLPESVMQTYADLRRHLVAELTARSGVGDPAAVLELAPSGPGPLVSVLRQLADGALYADSPGLAPPGATRPTVDAHGVKTEAVVHLVDLARERARTLGAPRGVLVLYAFRHHAERLTTALSAAGLRVGRDPTREHLAAWDAGALDVLLMHPASGGHGINLQHGGCTTVWAGPPWSLELWQQANARMARPGQNHPVAVYVVLAASTVDLAARARLDGRADAQQILLDHVLAPL